MKIRVVIVEDHAMVAEGFAAALCEEEDIDVVGVATTGEAALGMIAETAPDVVLVDFQLPDADGAAVTGSIRRDRPGTQVVILTAGDEPSVVARAIEAGAAGFVHKSEPIDHVARATRAVYGGEAWFRPAALAGLVGAIRRPRVDVGADLTEREREILALLADGVSTQAMVEALVLSPHTVRNHVRNIIMKLGAHSKLEAVAIAARAGLVSMRPRR